MLNAQLKNLVADQYQKAGFRNLADEIRVSKDRAGIQRVAISVLSKLMNADPTGFSKDVQNLCSKGDN